LSKYFYNTRATCHIFNLKIIKFKFKKLQIKKTSNKKFKKKKGETCRYFHTKKRGLSKPVDISSKSICLTCMEGEVERAAVKQLTAAAC
jgi:hypothetical protein